MKKSSPVLICTDLDGTLSSGIDIPAENIEAIKRFQESGGYFTLCTGRVLGYLNDNILKSIEPNTYIITLNGAVIVDSKTNEYLYRGYLDPHFTTIADEILEFAYDMNDVFVYYKDAVSAKRLSPTDPCFYSNLQPIDEIHKIVFTFKNEATTLAAKKAGNAVSDDRFEITRSWPTGLELLDAKSSKGEAVKRIKRYLKAKTLVTVGNYENDIPMLKAADISYAVANSEEHVKAEATRVTVSQEDAAIAKVIDDILALP